MIRVMKLPTIDWLTIISLLSIFAILASAPVHAEENKNKPLHSTNPSNKLFNCTQKTMGQTACQAGHRCKCEYSAFGDAMRGLPAGYKWNCDLTQGTCMSDTPATTSGHHK